jgi:hypothetical protein
VAERCPSIAWTIFTEAFSRIAREAVCRRSWTRRPSPQPGRRHCRAEVPLAPLGDPQRSATRHGEHKIGRGVGSVGQVSAKLLGEESWQRNDAALAGLGRPPRQPAVHLGRRLHHLNPAGEQIQPPDPKGGRLTDPQPRPAEKAHDHPVGVRDLGGEVLQLGRGQERHLAFDNAGSAKALGRVAVKPATRHRGVEDLAEDLGGSRMRLGLSPAATNPACHSWTAKGSIDAKGAPPKH